VLAYTSARSRLSGGGFPPRCAIVEVPAPLLQSAERRGQGRPERFLQIFAAAGRDRPSPNDHVHFARREAPALAVDRHAGHPIWSDFT
jgi:hypothetical protein